MRSRRLEALAGTHGATGKAAHGLKAAAHGADSCRSAGGLAAGLFGSIYRRRRLPRWVRIDSRIDNPFSEALLHGETVRHEYDPFAWVVMPNHVHLALKPNGTLSEGGGSGRLALVERLEEDRRQDRRRYRITVSFPTL